VLVKLPWAVAASVALCASGCFRWVPPASTTAAPVNPAGRLRDEPVLVKDTQGHVLALDRDVPVKFQLVDGRTIEVEDLRAAEWLGAEALSIHTSSDRALVIPRNQIVTVEEQRFSPLGTAALIATPIVVFGSTIMLLVLAGSGGGP
jgi:hypothetical protein